MRNEPVRLIKNVGKGNGLKRFCKGEILIKYRATAPPAPPAAMAKIRVKVSIKIRYTEKGENATARERAKAIADSGFRNAD